METEALPLDRPPDGPPSQPPDRRSRGLVVAAVAAAALIVAGGVWAAGRIVVHTDGTADAGAATTMVAPGPVATTTALATDWTAAPAGANVAAASTGSSLGILPAGAGASTSTAVATTAPPVTEPPTTTTTGPPPLNEDPAVVSHVQTRLAEMGYSVGDADGHAGSRTASAVMAFEKVEGLERDGVIGADVVDHIDNPQGAVAGGGSAVPRIEIDLSRQVIFVVTSGGTRIFNSSTGSGEDFTWPDGTPAVAYTPTGDFSVLRRIDGMDDGPLGSLYRPLYFFDGWAVHGSSYVPAYPASHGCARVSNVDQDWIWANVPNGAAVTVY